MSDPLLARNIPARKPPPNLMTRAFNGVVCTATGHQHPIREAATKLDPKATGHRPPANSIPEGSPPPRLMVRTTNGIVCAAAAQRHPRREPADNLDGQGDANSIIYAPDQHPGREPSAKRDGYGRQGHYLCSRRSAASRLRGRLVGPGVTTTLRLAEYLVGAKAPLHLAVVFILG